MHPTLIDSGPLGITLPSYYVLLATAVVVCLWIGPQWAEALEGVDRRKTRRALLLLGLFAFGGGRLHYVVNQWHLFADRPFAALEPWSGSLHAGGAITSVALAAPVVFRRCALPIGKVADGIAPAVGIGIAIARFGCFLHGCCFGMPCQWPWCVSFPRVSYIYTYHVSLGLLSEGATRSAAVHPLQLYFAAAGLGITAIALAVRLRKAYDGRAALVALLVYSVSAAVLEFFRADYYPRVYWGPLPQLEWVALAMTLAAAAALGAAELVHRHAWSVSRRTPTLQAPH